MQKIKALFLILSVFSTLLFFSSCVSYKNVPYLQDLDSTQVALPAHPYLYPIIQKADIIALYINSLSETTQNLFERPTAESDLEKPNGILVDEKGEIQV